MYWCTSVSECVFLMHKCVHVCVCVRVRVRVCLHGVRCSLLHSDRRAHPTSRSCLYAHIFCMHKRDLWTWPNSRMCLNYGWSHPRRRMVQLVTRILPGGNIRTPYQHCVAWQRGWEPCIHPTRCQACHKYLMHKNLKADTNVWHLIPSDVSKALCKMRIESALRSLQIQSEGLNVTGFERHNQISC